MKVLLFGQLTEIAGTDVAEINYTANTDILVRSLYDKYPALQSSKFLIAVNKEIITQSSTLQQDDEIALLPPFSGG